MDLSYTYDPLNRLQTVSGSAGGFDLARAYTYDPVGNLLSKDGLSYSYANPADFPAHAPSQVGNFNFSYDANGNRTLRSQDSLEVGYRYDELNRLAYVISETLVTGVEGGESVTQAVYDGDGQRVKRITAAGTTLTIGQHYEVFYPASLNQTVTMNGTFCANPSSGHYAPRLAVEPGGARHLVYAARPHFCNATLDASGQVIDTSGGGSYAPPNSRNFFDLAVDAQGAAYQLQQENLLGLETLFLNGTIVSSGTVEQTEGALAVEGTGPAHAVWLEGDSLHYAAVSGGAVLSSQVVTPTGAGVPRIAVDDGGLAHLIWRQVENYEPTIRYQALGSATETVSTETCPANTHSTPAVAVDAAGQVYAVWRMDDPGELTDSGPICFAVRAPTGGWTVSQLDHTADSDHLELQVTADGSAVYLLRGTRAFFEDVEGKGDYSQETLSLERYRAGQWQTLLVNTYPSQDGDQNDFTNSVLDGDLGLDAQDNAYVAWIDNGPTWEEDHTFRLRTTKILSTTVPQITKHYYANGQRVATRVDGDLYYTLGDHLGSTSLVVDAQGNEVGHVIYDAYGQIVENTVPLTLTDRLFTGQVFDASTGLYYYNARYYDPLTGQFTQPDSVVGDPLNPAAWNRFSYVYGNPVNLVDPSGYFAIAPWDFLDVISFGASLNDFVNDPSLANAGWLALDTISLLPLIPAVGAIHHAGKLSLADDTPKLLSAGTVVEFGAGLDLANARRIVEDYPGAKVLLTESEEAVWLARKKGAYDQAVAAGASVRPGDYHQLPREGVRASVSIAIAPQPGYNFWLNLPEGAMETAHTMADITLPGGRIYVAAREAGTAEAMAEVFSSRFSIPKLVPKPVPRAHVPYVSQYLEETVHVIDFRVPFP